MEPLTYMEWDELRAQEQASQDYIYYHSNGDIYYKFNNGDIYHKFNKDEFVPIYGYYTDIFEPENVQELITFEELMGK